MRGATQWWVDCPLGLIFVDIPDSPESKTLKILHADTLLAKCQVELARALARRPTRLKIRQRPRDFGAIDAVVAGIRPRSTGELNSAAWDGLVDDLRQFANPVVLLRPTAIDRLLVDRPPT